MLDVNTYEPQMPLVQMKGIDPVTNAMAFYKVDQNQELIYRYNSDTESWEYFREAGPFPQPANLQPMMTSSEKQEMEEYILNSGWFKLKTDYIYFGDEGWEEVEVVVPLVNFIGQQAYDQLLRELEQSGLDENQRREYLNSYLLEARTQKRSSRPQGVIDLEAKLGSENVEKFKAMFKFFPRAYLRRWYEQTVAPKIPAIGNQIVWAAIVDLFNQANREHIAEIGYSPWQWEQEKLQTYYLMENKKVLKELNDRFEAYKQLNNYPDPQAESLMREYAQLPKIGDLGLEISRQAVIKELLARKEYATVKGIIDAYRLADTTILGEAIRNKIPFDINAKQGRSVKASI